MTNQNFAFPAQHAAPTPAKRAYYKGGTSLSPQASCCSCHPGGGSTSPHIGGAAMRLIHDGEVKLTVPYLICEGHYLMYEEDTVEDQRNVMLQALMCRLNIRHEWHVEHAGDGVLYKRCRWCGKDDDERTVGGGNFSHWAGG